MGIWLSPDHFSAWFKKKKNRGDMNERRNRKKNEIEILQAGNIPSDGYDPIATQKALR